MYKVKAPIPSSPPTLATVILFLSGQNPSTSATKPSTYIFVVPKSGDVVDLFYWQSCPFNEANKSELSVTASLCFFLRIDRVVASYCRCRGSGTDHRSHRQRRCHSSGELPRSFRQRLGVRLPIVFYLSGHAQISGVIQHAFVGPSPQIFHQSPSCSISLLRARTACGSQRVPSLVSMWSPSSCEHHFEPRCSLDLERLDRPTLLPQIVLR